ncbi:hypothetical protein QW131_00950 [Roseibium salinum]|nr:hypothetical protein [Roseibium salinum]
MTRKAVCAVNPPSALPTASDGKPWAAVLTDVIAPGSEVLAPPHEQSPGNDLAQVRPVRKGVGGPGDADAGDHHGNRRTGKDGDQDPVGDTAQHGELQSAPYAHADRAARAP